MNFLRTALFVALFCTVLRPVFAQDSEPAAPPAIEKSREPTTTIEKFVARRGNIVIRDHYRQQRFSGTLSGILVLDLAVYSTPGAGAGNKVYGMRFLKPAPSSDRFPVDYVSFLDFDECQALSEALTYMLSLPTKTTGGSGEFDYTEVAYETRGRLRFGFEYREGKQIAFVEVGPKVVTMKMETLADVSKAIQAGLVRLKEMGAK
jgi:hypothetical protein